MEWFLETTAWVGEAVVLHGHLKWEVKRWFAPLQLRTTHLAKCSQRYRNANKKAPSSLLSALAIHQCIFIFLLQMLCEEQGYFLEIADIIRGFQLNILKGVMETRDDKIWARFIVEVNQIIRYDEIIRSRHIHSKNKSSICFLFVYCSQIVLQASSHVTRIDIFLSLVQLLKQTTTSSKDTAYESNNAIDGVGISLLDSNQQQNLLHPISLAETLGC